MKLTASRLLSLAYDAISAAPDGLKKNSTLRHLGQIMTNLGSYGKLCAQIPKPTMSEEGRKALSRASKEKPWVRKDCGCK
jgi:hypothetical protein